MEASFFITDDALRRITPNMQFDEDGVLSAFDLNRNLIYAIAFEVAVVLQRIGQIPWPRRQG
jgi:hypothetical protein